MDYLKQLEVISHQNKYTKWHNHIINRAISRSLKKTKNDGIERHHILPKSLGGNPSRENTVTLYAKEHFIVHLLLIKMLKEQRHIDKMTFALFNMKANNGEYIRDNNSKMYEYFKTHWQKLQSKRQTDYMSKEENRKKISEQRKDYFKIKENRDNLSKIFKGKKRPDLKKDVLTLTGDKRTEKQKQASLLHSQRMKGRTPWNKGLKLKK